MSLEGSNFGCLTQPRDLPIRTPQCLKLFVEFYLFLRVTDPPQSLCDGMFSLPCYASAETQTEINTDSRHAGLYYYVIINPVDLGGHVYDADF